MPTKLMPRLDAYPKSSHTPSTMIDITPQQLRKAANIQEKILLLQKELGQLLGGPAPAPAAARGPRKRRMSAQGLANIRAGVRKRMMAQTKGKAVQKPRRKMSAAAKARLSALAKARWAKAKRAGKTRL
jgi:hypothetical protein